MIFHKIIELWREDGIKGMDEDKNIDEEMCEDRGMVEEGKEIKDDMGEVKDIGEGWGWGLDQRLKNYDPK